MDDCHFSYIKKLKKKEKKRKEKKPCSIDALYLRPYQFCSNVHSFEEMGA
jgi:hypothetical protein